MPDDVATPKRMTPAVKSRLTTARRIAITQQVTEARAFPSHMTVVLGVVMAAAADELLAELRAVEAQLAEARRGLAAIASGAPIGVMHERESLMNPAYSALVKLAAATLAKLDAPDRSG